MTPKDAIRKLDLMILENLFAIVNSKLLQLRVRRALLNLGREQKKQK